MKRDTIFQSFPVDSPLLVAVAANPAEAGIQIDGLDSVSSTERHSIPRCVQRGSSFIFGD